MELHPERLTAVESVIVELQRRHPQRDPEEIEAWVRGEFVTAEFQARNDALLAQFIPQRVLEAVEYRLRCTPPGVSYYAT